MDRDSEEIVDFLAKNPELESPLQAIVSVEEDTKWWFPDQLSLEEDTLERLVSKGVLKHDPEAGRYRLSDRGAVKSALENRGSEFSSNIHCGGERSIDTQSSYENNATATNEGISRFCEWGLLPLVSNAPAAALAGAIVLVIGVRSYIFSSIFRGEEIVLSGNDPYLYRYWVELLAARTTGPLDLWVLGNLPPGVANGEPLMIATLWWVTSLFGGDPRTAGLVLAWYPVIFAAFSALLLYFLTYEVTHDSRVGISAVAILSIIPVHAFRTSLGFGDHHAFDYPWLVLTALGLVVIAQEPREGVIVGGNRRGLFALLGLGFAISVQSLAWEASPLLLAPIGIYAGLKTLVDVREGISPLRSNYPLIIVLGGAAGVVLLSHYGLEWHSDTVSAAPAMLLVGITGVVLAGESIQRTGLPYPIPILGVIELTGIGGALLVLRTIFPAHWTALVQQIDRLIHTRNIVETQSLFGDSAGWLLLFGFALVLAFPYLMEGSFISYRAYQPEWLVVSVYGWYFLALASLQLRFGGELALFVAVFAGLGFVHVSSWFDLARLPVPFRTGEKSGRPDDPPTFEVPDIPVTLLLVLVFILVGSLGFAQTTVKLGQLRIDDGTYETATAIEAYAAERSLTYPRNYVLSRWGRNRVYNYFVNGQSRSYFFAEKQYPRFLGTEPPGDDWYTEHANRVGFVVTRAFVRLPGNTMQNRLHRENGNDLHHYRIIYTSPDGSYRASALVPGAKLIGAVPQKLETATLTTRVKSNGAEFTYTQSVEANPYGVYRATVPYSGSYTVRGKRYSVSELDVIDGRRRVIHDRQGLAHWPFDYGKGPLAYDRVGGYTGSISKATWTNDSVAGTALKFDAGAFSHVDVNVSPPNQFTISLWVKPGALNTSPKNDYRHLVSGSKVNLIILEEQGGVSFRVPGVTSENFVRGDIRAGTWTHVAVQYNGTHRSIYVNGTRKGSSHVGRGTVDWEERLRIGAGVDSNGSHAFEGVIDDVRIYGRALTADEIRMLYHEGESSGN